MARRHASSDVIRTFVCIEVPEGVRSRIAGLQLALRQEEARVSWVKPENIHLTLKFLGPVAADRIPSVVRSVSSAASGIEPFEIEVAGTGCFPSPRNPKVFWVGLEQVPEPLKRLQADIDSNLFREGFPREERGFSPHLTIGRVREPARARTAAENLMKLGFDSRRYTASEVIVMRSDLKPTGSVYTRQGTVTLGIAPSGHSEAGLTG
jgi:2'-5' RNA ligase